MEMNLLITFILLNIANVIIQTVKSIATVKCGKMVASVVNAVAYGLYTIVTVYMLCELPLATKALIVALCNLVGVYAVKYFEEKARKDKLWKVEVTIPANQACWLIDEAKAEKIPFNYIDINKYYLFNFYCATQKDSHRVNIMLKAYNAKYFVSESKNL